MIKFETINGTLCRMVEPEPLQLDSPMPCVVRYIRDCSPMGRYMKRKYAMVIDTIAIVSRIGTDGCAYSSDKIFIEEVEVLEIIGYPVAEGSDWWALYQMMQGNKVSNPTLAAEKATRLGSCEVEQFNTFWYIVGDTVVEGKSNYGTLSVSSWIAASSSTGWQIYKEPKHPKPLLADAQVGDLCKHRNGDWSQIIDTNGTYIKGQPIRTTLKDTKGINRNFCLSGSYFTMQFGGGYDIIHTEPLAPEGTAEWAWQMNRLLGKKVMHPRSNCITDGNITRDNKDMFLAVTFPTGWQIYEEPESAKEPIADCDNCKHRCPKSNIDYCQMYEPNIEPPKEPDYVICKRCGGSKSVLNPSVSNTAYTTCPKCGGTGYEIKEQKYKVGDWVKHVVDSYLQVIEPSDKEKTWCRTLSGIMVYPYTSLLTKVSPSEVVIHIGCLSGKVSSQNDVCFALKSKLGIAVIQFAMLDTQTRELVESLLKAQKEETK